jgi:hypothetical protein
MKPSSRVRGLLLPPILAGAALIACESAPTPAPASAELGGATGSAPEPRGGATTEGDPALRPDRFVTTVVSFTPGPCSGFGADAMPEVVLGPPVGRGAAEGSFDVVSLGIGGEIVVSFEPNAIVDGPGADFIVFENAFYAGGNPDVPAADPGEISVSDDGSTWETYPCTAGAAAPYGACAGWHPVFSAPGNGVSSVDPSTAGGEAYDLADLGLTQARFVRVRDRSSFACEGQPRPNNLGFDLDAVAIVNAKTP